MLHTHLMRLTNKFPRFPLGGLLSFVLFYPMFKPLEVSVSLRIASSRAKFLLYFGVLSIPLTGPKGNALTPLQVQLYPFS